MEKQFFMLAFIPTPLAFCQQAANAGEVQVCVAIGFCSE